MPLTFSILDVVLTTFETLIHQNAMCIFAITGQGQSPWQRHIHHIMGVIILVGHRGLKSGNLCTLRLTEIT